MKQSSNQFYKSSLKKIKTMILDTFKDDDVTIIQFGSTARGDAHDRSDIDIGILPKDGFDNKKLILLRDRIENLNIPYTVDLVDISKTSPVFKEQVLKEGIIWKS